MLVEHIRDWNLRTKDRAEPTFTYWPKDSRAPEPGSGVAVLVERHGLLAISWSARPSTPPAHPGSSTGRRPGRWILDAPAISVGISRVGDKLLTVLAGPAPGNPPESTGSRR
jgi:hypothetical protein